MKRWITADWHLGEDRMAMIRRPFSNQKEMIDTLILNHNRLVSPEDTVYVLGDVCYQKALEFLPEVNRFNGKKILLRGNHDRLLTDEQLHPYFQEIVPEGTGLNLTVGNIDCFLVHYPSCASPNKFNLVGHIHDVWKCQLNMLNVGVDCNHFMPHNLDEAVPFFLKVVTEFFDDDVWSAYNPANQDYFNKRGRKGSYYNESLHR